MRKFAWIAVVVCLVPLTAQGEDWPQFLGPQRNGISKETGLIADWPGGGPKELWRVPGGVGLGGVSIASGKAITLVQHDGKQWVLALDAASGKKAWETPLAAAYENQMGDGPRAAPTIVDGAVYVFGGDGTLGALDTKSGKLLWSHDVPQNLGGKPAEYGMACSPLVVGDLVIVTAGVPGGTVAAFDRKSGKLAWKAGRDTAGYSSPALREVGGRQQVVVFTGKAALGLDPKEGTELWRYAYKTDYDCNIATPLAYQGNVFVSSGENHGSTMLALKPSGDSFTVSEVWASTGPQSTLRNEWQTSIVLDRYLYGLDNVGSAGPVTHLTCVEADTGKRVWQQPRFGKSNLIYADGKLFFSTMAGELVVVRATPKGFEELGRKQYVGKTRQAPALANGRLYLRDDREIVCLDVRGK